MKKRFFKYITQNILGMLGLSCYILADTIFISQAEGSDGLTALNLVLPLYSFIFAIGAMVGVGSAIRYAIAKSKKEEKKDDYLFQAVFFTFLVSIVFLLIGVFLPEKLLIFLGADARILEVGLSYTRIFLCFAPFFMWNHIANAYVRNDNAPTVAMVATLSSSLFNILFDYIFMFPLQMGMKGAALATSLSPIVGILICCIHFFSKESSIRFKIVKPSLKEVLISARLGISAFIGEISSGVITLTFNYLILGLAGNVGVAAYGVVANTAIVTNCVFNGVAQGSQPLISEAYGKGKKENVRKYRNYSLLTALFLAILLYAITFLFAKEIVFVFNREQDAVLEKMAFIGIRLYFIGILFAGVNIVGGSFFSATEQVKNAFLISILRGFVLILLSAFLMAALFGMNGVWLSYALSEGITLVVFLVLLFHFKH